MKTINIIKTLTSSVVMVTFMVAAVSCSNDDDNGATALDFSGTFAQEDQMGRPGIATVFPTTATEEDSFNVTIPSQMGANFQTIFEDKLNGLHAAFGVNYENNILGLDATTLTTVLASDVLQVAPDEITTYFDGTNVLTGRNLTDDVIDISLVLLFGGNDGQRFNGENGTPELVSDNVGSQDEPILSVFPYAGRPN
ncbi:DUF4331 family protein [Sungkyunkwania multivorans]|uniref:DUF4331 family protein n=1 Tax=Sungkyunkwania multivorans TaxID=1173618 RepID=A0ABW3CUD4_9FLAO